MSLPDKNRKFYFDHKDEYGIRLEGYFTIKCKITMRERHIMELEKTRILGGHNSPTNTLLGIAIMIATLNVHIIEAPEWWKQSNNGLDLEDESIIAELYDQVTTEQISWRDELIAATTAATKEAQEANEEAPRPNGSVETN